MKLWIDTDSGVDDATAIIFALNAPNVEIVGISCVGGNVQLENVIKNVNRTLWYMIKNHQKEIPIYAGCSRALVNAPMVIPEIHGKDGLGDINNQDFDIDESEFKCDKSKHAINALIECVSQHQYSKEKDDRITLLCIAPLTNIAIALRMAEKQMINGIKEIIIMGGCEEGNGNTSKFAEFNFRCDPEAAQIVFSTFPQDRIKLISWDLTKHFQFSSKDDLDLFQGNKVNTKLGDFIKKTWKPVIDYSDGLMQMADPLASFVACYPESVINDEKRRINIVLDGEKVGMCHVSKDVKNEGSTAIITEIDFDQYKNIFLKLIKHQ